MKSDIERQLKQMMIDELRLQVAAAKDLVTALLPYVRHLRHCPMHWSAVRDDCTCGLDALLTPGTVSGGRRVAVSAAGVEVVD